jgi:post-segregation antitoxin (ccd killing protein)
LAARRGRPQELKNPVRVLVTIEKDHLDLLRKEGLNVSVFCREAMRAFYIAKETPEEQLDNEIEVTIRRQQEDEQRLKALLERRKEIKKEREREKEETEQKERLEAEKKEYIVSCILKMKEGNSNLNLWLDYVKDRYNFTNREEAKQYIRKVWIREGVPEHKVKKHLRIT